MIRSAPRPVSAVPFSDGVAGVIGVAVSWSAILWLGLPAAIGFPIVLAAAAAPMLALELGRMTSEAWPSRRPALSWPAAIGFILAALPFLIAYSASAGVAVWAIDWCLLAPLFLARAIIKVSRTAPTPPSTGFPALLGGMMFGRQPWSWRSLVGPEARLWALKAFFLPVYAASLYHLLDFAGTWRPGGFAAWLTLALDLAYTVDLSFALVGYISADDALLPTIRSTQHRLSGWVVCLACYGPVFAWWPDFRHVVEQEIAWPRGVTSEAAAVAAAAMMLVMLGFYISATVAFGLRFSNLSNRGIVTSGPYRLMKHPAYAAHVGNSWLITLVLLPAAGYPLDATMLAVPIAFTLLYRARAITEEQHLSADPDYRAYCDWIAEHGLVARIRRLARPHRRPAPQPG